MRGMTEYLPTTFKGVYFSVSHGIIHTAVIDFKWRDQLLINITNDTDENGVYVENRMELNTHEMEEMLFKYAYSPPCLEDYLLGDEKDFYEQNISKQTLETVFGVFISPLIQNWENLKRTYEELLLNERDNI